MTKKKETAQPKEKVLRITLVKSAIGFEKSQGETARALGLRKLHTSVVKPDNSTVRGMVWKIRHLVEVEEVER
jgi:large subunit ribosomal protein L30